MYFVDQITLVAAVITSFFFILLLLQRNPRTHFGILITFALYMSFGWSMYFVTTKSALIIYSAFLVLPAAISSAPATYYYVDSTTTGRRVPKWASLTFFVFLPVAIFLGQLTIFMIYPEWQNVDNHLNLTGFAGQYVKVFAIVATLWFLIFMVLAAKTLLRYRTVAPNNVYQTDLGWLYLFFLGLIITYAVAGVSIFITTVSGKNFVINSVTNLVMALHTFLMIYFLTQRPQIVAVPKPQTKYAKQTLPSDTSQEYLTALVRLMRDEKPFLNEDITLAQLADDLDIPAHHLSMVINSEMSMNFYQLINHFRVEEAKSLMQQNKDISVLRIGYRAGFRSKTAFNSAFKKLTGKTPGQFRDMLGQNGHDKEAS